MQTASQASHCRLPHGVVARSGLVDLRHDRFREPVEQLRRGEGILVGRHLELTVANPLERDRVEQPAKHAALPHENCLMDGVVFAIRVIAAPVHPVRGHELVVELGRKREGLGAEHLLLEERQGVTLFLRLDDAERRGGIGIPLVTPRRVETSDQTRGRVHRLAVGRQQHAKRLPHPLVATRPAVFFLGGHAVGDERHHLRHQLGAALCEFQRIVPEVEPVRERVGIAELGLLVGGVGQCRLATASGDLLEFRKLGFGVARGERLVAILDRPEVVGANLGGVVVALRLPLRHDVHRDVVHHARAGAGRGGLRHVVDVGQRLERAPLEVVTQAQRVPDLVHRDELKTLQDELLLVALREASLGCGGQCRRGEGGLAGMAVEEGAGAAAMAVAAAPVGLAAGQQRHALRRESFIFRPPESQEVAVEDDVGVEDLAGPRIHPRRPHGEARAGGDPAERVVVDILGVPVGHLGLLADLDGGGEAGFLEGLVPRLDALSDGLPILKRNRLLDPEHDRLLGRRDRCRRVGLFQVPAVDVTDEPVLIHLLREVLEGRHKVTDAVVGQSGPVAVLREQAQRVVHGDRGAPRIWHGVDVPRAARAVGRRHLEFDVVRKTFYPRPRGPIPCEGKAGQLLGDLRQVREEDRPKVDDMATGGACRHDRHAEEHAVCVGEVDRLFFGAPLVGKEPDVLADDLNVVIDLAELPHPVVPEAEAHAAEQKAVTDALRDRDEHEELLAKQGVSEFGVDFVVFPPERNQTAHLGRVLEHHGERRLAPLGLGRRFGGLGVGRWLGWRRCGCIGLGLLCRGLGGRVFGPGCHARS